MLRIAMIVCALALLLALPASAELVRSGQFIMEWTDGGMGGGDGGDMGDRTQVLSNDGFESGSLPPWTTNGWSATTADAHSGSYSATDVGNYWIMQSFTPIDVNQVNSVGFWSRQPEVAIQAVDFFYGAADYDEFLIFPLSTWSYFDVTANLRAAGNLEAIRIWGYSGGGPDEDRTYIDDALVDGNVVTPVAEGSWGQIKQLY
jgi:hypothetical protein